MQIDPWFMGRPVTQSLVPLDGPPSPRHPPPASAGAPLRLRPSAWIVPGVLVAVLVLGTVVAAAMTSAELFNNPTGVVQPGSPSRAPIPNQISTTTVEMLIAPPYASFVGAALAFVGVRNGPSRWLALGGIFAGVATFTVLAASADTIGQWWLTTLPTDTNLTAGIWAALLAPPGSLSLLLALLGLPWLSKGHGKEQLATLLMFGVIFGILTGAIVGFVASTVTWAASCPQTYSNCFAVGGVIGSGGFVGGLVGAGLGIPCGALAWVVRPKEIGEVPRATTFPSWGA